MRLPSQQRYKSISTGHEVQHNRLTPEEGMEHEDIVKEAESFKSTSSNSSADDALILELGYDEKARKE